MLENYRTSQNFNEIVKILYNSVGDKHAFLWQNIDKKRFIFPINDIAINERFSTFQVKVENAGSFKLKDTGPTYAKFTYKETVFKVEVISRIGSNIALSLPSEVKALELRDDFRSKFKPSDQKAVTLKVAVELMMGATQEFRFQAIDISKGGLSIVISEKDIKYFEDGSSFELTKLQNKVIEYGYVLEYVYSQKFRFKSQGRVKVAYKVGLKAVLPFEQSDLDSFISQ